MDQIVALKVPLLSNPEEYIWATYEKTTYKDSHTYTLIVNSYGAFDNDEIVEFRYNTNYKEDFDNWFIDEIFLENV